MRSLLTALALVASVVVQGSPFPQGVTEKISPPARAPQGCSHKRQGTFGVAVLPISPYAVKRSPRDQRKAWSTSKSCYISEFCLSPPTADMAPFAHSTTREQGGASVPTTALPSVTSAGQRQARIAMPASVVTQIVDGQIQAPGSGSIQVITQISDGQIQAPTVSDSQIEARKASTASKKSKLTISRSAITQGADHQAHAPTSTSSAVISDMTIPASTDRVGSVACRTEGNLEVGLHNGVLTDMQSRTGYIASNFQFQFDSPPQSESLYTAGFSVCNNGSIALGDTVVWWQCLSGDFYNLYYRDWAAQCTPAELTAVTLIDC